ncbi:MAG TPA: M23 family metallopeptidase [Vicinamibacteria bacterium]|nr:M23 family metallopeptidase [Vicinamibacteria bacterium]
MRRALLLLSLLLAADAAGQGLARRAGNLRIEVDEAAAYPGGLLAVRLRSPQPLGATYAILEGRRFPFFASRGVVRALVPIEVGTRPGPATLGIEIRGRRGRRRIPVAVQVDPRAYTPRVRVVPDAERILFALPNRTRDSRMLLQALHTITPAQAWSGRFQAPVTGAQVGTGFGGESTYVGGSPVEEMLDSIHGEYHRGLDYEVVPGRAVTAPAAGTVLLARMLALSGLTVVIDHGQGVTSALYHLSRLDVREGQRLDAGAPVGLSGASGLAIAPHLHWGVYVHAVAVDPAAFEKLTN